MGVVISGLNWIKIITKKLKYISMDNQSFKTNWGFQEKYIPRIREILKKHSIHFIDVNIAPKKEDMEEATDMIITANRGHVAVRIRRGRYTFRDITIRSKNGTYKTEIDKIMNGYADFYLYAWENKDRTDISEYALIDINKARIEVITHGYIFKDEIPNNDGKTAFIAFDIEEFRKCGALLEHQIN